MDPVGCCLLVLLLAQLASSPTAAALDSASSSVSKDLELSNKKPTLKVQRRQLFFAGMQLGDPELQLQDVPVHYYVPDGVCSGLVSDQELGCGGAAPMTLVVQAVDQNHAPNIKISKDLNVVIVRRRPRYSGDKDACSGRLWLRIRVACPPRSRRSISSGADSELRLRPMRTPPPLLAVLLN